ncbi:MAG: mannose-6-phosphate isomerase, class I [Myxococcota bacterium]
MALLPLSPRLQHYAWGDTESIPRLLGRSPDGRPVAEAWYGAHPSAPADADGQPLDAVIAKDPATWLGPELQAQHDGLPYLLKLLAAARPLSIQVHPNARQAKEGHERETQAGTESSQRRFKDPRHKPELLVALTPFVGLCGFLSAATRSENYRDAGLAEAWPELGDPGRDLPAFLRAFFALSDEQAQEGLAAWLQRLGEEARSPDDLAHWTLRAHQRHGSSEPDRGLLFTLLLERIHLEPGEGLFLPAGVPHAYLEGAGVEIMASSDNVLRAGLTAKPVDPAALLEVVRFDATRPPISRPVPWEGESLHLSPTAEFELGLRQGAAGSRWERKAQGPETLLCLGGRGRVEDLDSGRTVTLQSGGACLLGHGTAYRVHFEEDTDLWRARVPFADEPGRFRDRAPTELRFGTSGLRGLVEDITDLEAYVNARGFLEACIARGAAVPGTRVELGRDRRPSTPRIARAVSKAARDLGLRPVDAGVLPTPALTLQGIETGRPSIMVTGSHIPFDRNGIKFNFPEGEVRKADEPGILAAVARVRRRAYGTARAVSPFDDQGALRSPEAEPEADDEARRRYHRRYLEAFENIRGVRIAFWAHSAAGRDLLPEALRSLGAQVHVIGRSEDFVAIDTEAIDRSHLEEMQALHDQLVAKVGPVDLFVSTDGDSDRPLVLVPEDGRLSFIPGDLLGCLVARSLGADGVVLPVSANDGIDQVFPARVTRTRIGSPWVIAGMAEAQGDRVVGWEANGGFLTRDEIPGSKSPLRPLPTRDALLPIVCVAQAAASRTLGEALRALPARYGASGLMDGVAPSRSRALLRLLDEDPSARLEIGLGEAQHMDRTDGLRLRFAGGQVAHIRPSGNAPQLRVYAQADQAEEARAIVDRALASNGWLDRLLQRSDERSFVEAVRRNIRFGAQLFQERRGPQVMGAVSGTEGARRFWQRELDRARDDLGLRVAVSQHEDLPVNQAFGILLMWRRLRPLLETEERALFAFVFGEGSRAAPLTEAECGQKPALSSFVRQDGRWLSTVELALRTFAPVEDHLFRSGFRGVVIKWGDEVQIPSLDLSNVDPRLEGADVVRFVSLQRMDEDSARNKDWVGVDAEGLVTAFIPRRTLAEMRPLAERGLLQARGDGLWGGINLGSVALSRELLDALLETFEAEVMDPSADRKTRPDLDPQLFTALTLAVRDPRPEAWKDATRDSPALHKLERDMPGIFERLVECVRRFEKRHGRAPKLVALDFGAQYWGDVGQHAQMRQVFMALREPTATGAIARALAGLPEHFDDRGNLISEGARIGAVDARDSVLLEVTIDAGRIEGGVLVGTRCRRVEVRGGFDVGSVAGSLRIEARGGAYRAVGPAIEVAEGERLTTLFLPEGPVDMRVHEDTDLRDRPRNYEAPICGNPMSFAEARRRVLEEDPADWEARRTAAQAEVLDSD